MLDARQPAATTRRAWRWTAVVAAAGALLGFLVGRSAAGHASAVPIAVVILCWIVTCAGIAGALSLVVAQLGLSRRVRAPFQGLRSDEREVVKRVAGGHGSVSDEHAELRARASAYAEAMCISLPMSTVQFLCIAVALAALQLPGLARQGDTFSPIFSWGLLAAVSIAAPLAARRLGQYRRFLREDAQHQASEHTDSRP